PNEGHGFTRATKAMKVTGFSRCGTAFSRVAGGFRLCRKSPKNDGRCQQLEEQGTLQQPSKLLSFHHEAVRVPQVRKCVPGSSKLGEAPPTVGLLGYQR